MNSFQRAVLYGLTLSLMAGCGGTPVEEQERFQAVMNRSPDAAAADAVRSVVSTLRHAVLGGGEGMSVAQMEVQTAMEDTHTLDPNRFSDEHKLTVSSIMDKMQELQHANGRAEAKEILDKMEELTETLPR